jgi:mono/diheme cytochrome c family protein
MLDIGKVALEKKILLFATILFTEAVAFAAPRAGCPVLAAEKFELSALTSLIRSEACQVKTIDDVLGLLPEAMRSSVALFYKSQSLQGPHRVDYANPRAILSSVPTSYPEFPLKPAMMLSFNGQASQPGYNRLEIVNLDPSGGEQVFKYHEITFPEEGKARTLTWEQVQKEIQISPPNPQRCVQCHGLPARPVFQQYPRWDGAYGARHTSKFTAEEDAGFEEFKKAAAQGQSRYRHLNPDRMGVESIGRAMPVGERKITDALLFGGAGQSIEINTALSHYNGLRVASLIRKQSFYTPFRFAIVGAFERCQNMMDLLTASVHQKLSLNIASRELSLRSLQETESLFTSLMSNKANLGFGAFSSLWPPTQYDPQDPQERKEPTVAEQMTYHKAFWKNDPVLFALSVDTMSRQGAERFVPEVAMLRLIFEGQGVDISGWWADLKQGTYRNNPGFAKNWSLPLEILDPSLGTSEYKYGSKQTYEEFQRERCEKLATLSQGAMAGFSVETLAPISATPSPSSYPQVFVKTCAKCHVENEVGPKIPFQDQNEMNQRLQDKEFARKIYFRVFEAQEGRSMPPTRFLTPAEKREIADYLKKFL